jgi:hypothetical protein
MSPPASFARSKPQTTSRKSNNEQHLKIEAGTRQNVVPAFLFLHVSKNQVRKQTLARLSHPACYVSLGKFMIGIGEQFFCGVKFN